MLSGMKATYLLTVEEWDRDRQKTVTILRCKYTSSTAAWNKANKICCLNNLRGEFRRASVTFLGYQSAANDQSNEA
jgi:hypothetical protein